MSAPEKRTRAQERLLAAQRPPAERARSHVPDSQGSSSETTTGGDSLADSPGADGPEAFLESHDRAAAHSEGLELVGHLGTGRGTRTWLAKEEFSREKFTVTFATGTAREEREAQQRSMSRVAEFWAGNPHPHLVPVRGIIGNSDCAEALVSGHVTGISLARRIAQDGRVPPAEISPILTAAAKGLAALHDQGWVHGTLSQHNILLGPDREVWLDGYGVPATTDVRSDPDLPAVVSWGHDDRPEMLDRGVARIPADDVKALATLAWVALTGRVPGSDSHRVPLTLVCPAAPRGLVLMLEAALNDDPEPRPTAHEFATGIAAIPAARTAPRTARPSTPQIIRADGTEVRLGRAWRPRSRRGSSSSTASAVEGRSWRRPLVLALAATAVVGCAWFGVAELTGGETSPVATEREVSGADAGAGAESPGAAEEAARRLVSSRAHALAAGDEQALTAVYVKGSALAESDRSTIAHAADRDGGASDYSVLSGLSMEVDRLEPASVSDASARSNDERDDERGSEDAQTFYAEILTRGWHGELPSDSHVDREDATVRQSVHITVAHTNQGWRIADVTPVERQG